MGDAMTFTLVIIGVFVFFLLIALMIFLQYDAHQQALENRAVRAKEGTAQNQARSALLRRVLPQLLSARQILHEEVVELVGKRAEFAHTLASARSYKEGITQGATEQRTFERTQYKHAMDVRRLQNQLAAEIDRAALRPLRLEAQRTRLRVEANERVVESILTQQAIEEAHGRKRGAPTPSTTTLMRAQLGQLIEQYKADGKEFASLEAAFDALNDDAAEGEH
jgi:hypothetical protein